MEMEVDSLCRHYRCPAACHQISERCYQQDKNKQQRPNTIADILGDIKKNPPTIRVPPTYYVNYHTEIGGFYPLVISEVVLFLYQQIVSGTAAKLIILSEIRNESL